MEGQWTDSALKILKERYLQTGSDGVQETPEDMLLRVAGAIALADKEYGVDEPDVIKTQQAFYKMLIEKRFIPNSPTLMNAGLENRLQYSACYVLPVEDSIWGIFESIKNAADVHRSGGGTGFSFSRLRPNGNLVSKSGGVASGPVSFMRVFDAATEAIKQGGRRRGANMGVLRVDHPDIKEFITCKLEGGITNFNISVGITEAFMVALETKGNYDILAGKGWPRPEGDRYEGGEVIGQKNARKIFEKIVSSAWKTGDPGLLFMDRINKSPANPTPLLGEIEATNPCGEMPLFPNEACNLGSINLAKFAHSTETISGKEYIDWDGLKETVKLAVHFLDNVITVNPYPLPEIDRVVKENRRIGVGVMGWADMLFALKIPYNSEKALKLAEEIMLCIKQTGHEESFNLSQTRGVFPNWDKSIYKEIGMRRNSAVTTIAPTGSISIIAGTSSGVEPLFALAYRHISETPEGKRVLTLVNPIFERELRKRRLWSNSLMERVIQHGSIRDFGGLPADLREVFVTAHEIEPHWHVRMQGAFQKHTDNGVSKTVNLPHDATRHDIEAAYLLAYDIGCLGITIFRDGSKGAQVLNIGPEVASPKAVKTRPTCLKGSTYRKKTPVGTCYITVNTNGENEAEPFEVFINVGKAGSATAANAEGIGRLISLILRMPGPSSSYERTQSIIGQLRGIGSGRTQGFGPDKILSLSDAISQALAEHIGLESASQFIPGLPEMDESSNIGDLCPKCGHATFVREEGCQKCHSCGYSEC